MAGASLAKWTVLTALVAAGAAGAYVWSGGAVPQPVAGWLSAAGIAPKGAKDAPQAQAGGAGKPGAQGVNGGPGAGGGRGNGGAGPAGGRPPVSVAVGQAVRRDMPVRIDAIGTVQPVASVSLRSRVDSQIVEVAFEDGAHVKRGDTLFKLDSRQIEAQIAQAEANVARDRASLQAAEADLRRTEALARRDFATEKLLDTSRASVAQLQAAIRSGEAQVENLKVQRSYFTISAPISGRVGVAGLKLGNIAKAGDASLILGTINQMAPIYVAFALPQRHLPEVRAAAAAGTARVLATPQGYERGAEGSLAVIENTVDAQTGTISLRAQFENRDEALWPGALCQVRVTLRNQANALVVPREAVLAGQAGNFVFVAADGVAKARQVTVDRIVDEFAVLTDGLNGGETVVVDGQQLLADGSRIIIRKPGGGGAPPSAGADGAKPSSRSAS